MNNLNGRLWPKAAAHTELYSAAGNDAKWPLEKSLFRQYLMHARTLKLAAIFGLLAGLVVSAAMTFVDWRLNPASLFHNESGTDWTVVAETVLSWLGPVALVTFLATAIVLYSIAWFKSR